MMESKKQLQAIRREHDIAVSEGNEALARGIRRANPDLFQVEIREENKVAYTGVLVGFVWFAALVTLVWALRGGTW